MEAPLRAPATPQPWRLAVPVSEVVDVSPGQDTRVSLETHAYGTFELTLQPAAGTSRTHTDSLIIGVRSTARADAPWIVLTAFNVPDGWPKLPLGKPFTAKRRLKPGTYEVLVSRRSEVVGRGTVRIPSFGTGRATVALTLGD